MRRLVPVLVAVLTVTALAAPTALAQSDDGNGGEPTLGDAGGGKPKRTDDYRSTLKDAIADIQAYWTEEFPRLYRADYTPIPRSRVFAAAPGAKLPRCGGDRITYDDIRGNAAYISGCPGKPFVIYDDAERLPQIHRDFGGLAVPLVFAHEWGHVVQDQAGTIDGRVIVRELQADCFAGSWMRRVAAGDSARVRLKSGNLDSALAAMLSLADPVGISEGTDQDAHGSGFDRTTAFQQGFDDGAPACVPYIETPPPIVEIPFTSAREASNGGNLPADEVIPASVDLLNDFYTQVEPAYTPKTIDDIYSFDSSKANDLPKCGGTKQDAATVKNRVFYCIDDGDFGFEEKYLQHIYDDIGDFGVTTLLANPFATYVETIQQFPGVNDNADNAVLGADCYTGGFAAAMFNGALLVDPSTGDPKYELSPGDLDETIQAFIDYSAARGVSKDLDVTFARLRAFRDGFLNGYSTCSGYASATASFG